MSRSQSLANCFVSFQSEESCEMHKAMINEVVCRWHGHCFILHFKKPNTEIKCSEESWSITAINHSINYESLSKVHRELS